MASNCSVDLPEAVEYLHDLSVVYLVFIGITGVLTLVTVGMYIETVVFFFQNLYNWKPKDKAKWVLAVYPIYILTSFISLVVPRSANVNELIAICYFAICVYQFVTMLIGHYGGARRMSTKIPATSIHMDTTPCCCCCKCLPTLVTTSHNIHVVQTLVIQYAIAGPVLAYAVTVIMTNNYIYASPWRNPSTYLSLIMNISSIVAMWGMSVTFNLAAPLLSHAHIKQKYFCVQLVNVFTNLQSFIINILILAQVIECEGKLNASAVGLRYHNICMIFEMFGVWLLARHYYRRDIQQIPVEDQVYVETRHMSTSVSGTLTRDLDPGYQAHGPTTARQVMKMDDNRGSLQVPGQRFSAPAGLQDEKVSLDFDTKPRETKTATTEHDAKKKKKHKGKDKHYENLQVVKEKEKQKCEMAVGTDPMPEPPFGKASNGVTGGIQASAWNNTSSNASLDKSDLGVVVDDIDVNLSANLKDFPGQKGSMKELHMAGNSEELRKDKFASLQAPIAKPVRQRNKQTKSSTEHLDTALTGADMSGRNTPAQTENDYSGLVQMRRPAGRDDEDQYTVSGVSDA